jgi:hypothetical protein
MEYDIQGNVVPKKVEMKTVQKRAIIHDNARGSGSDVIPSTLPSSHVAVPPVGHRTSGELIDPIKSAVDGNMAGLKSLGQYPEMTEADVKKGPVLFAIPAKQK